MVSLPLYLVEVSLPLYLVEVEVVVVVLVGADNPLSNGPLTHIDNMSNPDLLVQHLDLVASLYSSAQVSSYLVHQKECPETFVHFLQSYHTSVQQFFH